MEMSCEHDVDHHLLSLHVDLISKRLVKSFWLRFWPQPTDDGNLSTLSTSKPCLYVDLYARFSEFFLPSAAENNAMRSVRGYQICSKTSKQ